MINAEKVPNHIGIIMDGNGRWATQQGKSRTYGHEMGAQALLNIIDNAIELDIKVLSVYAFSTENFNRPKLEVEFLMKLFIKAFKEYFRPLIAKNVKIVFSGSSDKLSSNILKVMDETVSASQNNTGLILNICFNYGAYTEVTDMIKKIMIDKVDADLITPEFIQTYFYQSLPPIDLLIRTSGEQRLSNFMLLQSAYAELYFTETLWPDFDKTALLKAIEVFNERERRYGGLNESKSS